MKNLIIFVASFLIAGIIVSPFLGLSILKEKNKWMYAIVSLIVTSVLFYLIDFLAADYIVKNFVHHYDQLDYVDGISFGSTLIILIASICSPFVFTKIIYNKVSLRSFFISIFVSIIIILIYAYILFFVIIPGAFGSIFKNLN